MAKKKTQNQSLLSQDDLYELQKEQGLRDDSGRWKIQKLKPYHKEMLEAHLAGKKNKDIAENFGVTPVTVSRILNDPLARKYLEIGYLSYEQELRGLAGDAIAVVRDALSNADVDIRLKSIDKYDKLVKLLTPEGREIAKGGSMSVTIGSGITQDKKEEAVDRLLDRLNGLFEKKPELMKDVVDVDFEEVSENETGK